MNKVREGLKNMVYYDCDNPNYIKCCEIVEKLEELDCGALLSLVISLVANYPETRDFVIGQYQEILIEDEEDLIE